MKGETTAIVLGAGASFCYCDGDGAVPIQTDLVGRLFFGGDTGSGVGFPSFIGPSGLKHSFELAGFLRDQYGIPEDPTKRLSKGDYWTRLQERGFRLETLYAELEELLGATRPDLVREFESIVRTAVTEPLREREPATSCRYHRLLAEALEPGDYIVSFNWDSLAADALLHSCPFWFPASGFGVRMSLTLLPKGLKSAFVSSEVHLLQIHGSTVVFEGIGNASGHFLYLGPRQYSAMTGLMMISGIPMGPGTTGALRPTRNSTKEEENRISLGHIFLEGEWFEPVFVPPSRQKVGLDSPYVTAVRSLLHSQLPLTRRICVLGYSFPEADAEHLSRLFVPGIMRPDLKVEIVNPENDSAAFQARAASGLGHPRSVDFSEKDFRSFCRKNATDWSKALAPE